MKFAMSYKFKPFKGTPYLGVHKTKTIVIHAQTESEARDKVWNYVPKKFNPGGFYEYGVNEIVKVERRGS